MIRVGIYLGSMSGPGTGAWTRFIALAEQLNHRENLQVTVFTDDEKAHLMAEYCNINVVTVPKTSRIHKAVRLRRDIERLVAKNNLDVLHFETLPIPKGINTKIVYTLHDLRSHYPRQIGGGTWRDIPRKIALKRISTRVDFVVTPSQWAKADINRLLGVSLEKIIVIPQILKIPSDITTNKYTTLPGKKRYVLALGHIEIRKNLSLLVKALQCEEWPQDITLQIIGRDLGQRKVLEDLYKTNSQNELIIGSEVTEEEKWILINSAAVIVVPSLIEGYGIVSVEGVLAGVPVLVSDQSALPEVIGVTEAVLPAHDPKAWAIEIKKLTVDQEKCDLLVSREIEYLRVMQQIDYVGALIETYLSLDTPRRENLTGRTRNK